MNPFVSGLTFKHDVFVSYAHVDNPTFGQAKGWVEVLVDHLRELLPQKLQRGTPEIWFDRSLPRNQPFPERIQEAVTHAATLLIILSENYFLSDWCQAELMHFREAANRTGGATGRIFLVRVDDLEAPKRPDPLQTLLGYEFFVQDENKQRPYVLGSPMANDEEHRKLYFRRFDDLRCELAAQLLRMREAVAAQETQASASNPDQPTIFLAEGTPDLEENRENIRRHLKQMNFRVLPETLYKRSPEEYQRAAEADLDRSLVFVQILGSFVTPKTEDLPKGYEGLQLDLAEAKNIPILRWHSPDLDPGSFSDQDLLQRADVMAMPFEDFKRKVIMEVQQQATRKKWSSQKLAEAFILLKANPPGLPGFGIIQALLDQVNIGYDTADENECIEVLVDAYPFHGFVIVYDRTESPWVKNQLRICRKLRIQKGEDAPAVCVVYTVPPPEAPNLGIRIPNMRHVSHEDYDGLYAFFADVQARVNAP